MSSLQLGRGHTTNTLLATSTTPRSAELQPKKRLGSQEAVGQECWSTTAGRPSLGSFSLGLLGLSPCIWIPTNPLDFWRFQSLCVQ